MSIGLSQLQSLHTHSFYDDGKGSLEEIASKAKAEGLNALGYSVHSPIDGESWCINKDSLLTYENEVKKIKDKYKGEMKIYMGLEYDLISLKPNMNFDYIILSMHHIKVGGDICSVDLSLEYTREIIRKYFAWDPLSYAEEYYNQLKAISSLPFGNIIGHFDLVTKFNEVERLIDEDDPRYIKAYVSAAEVLVKTGKIFEVNTGAMSRGLRTTPYPSFPILKKLHDLGGKVTITADSHSTDALIYGYDEALDLVKKAGFDEIWVIKDGEFKAIKI